MSRVFITGDIHGGMGLNRFDAEFFPEGKELTKDDYVIICGDFGIIWDNESGTEIEKYWLEYLNSKPWTTLFVDGNHENFTRLNGFQVEKWHGGKVHRVADSILHLMRGQIYEIGGKSWFAFGGAESVDKAFRTPYRSWWPQEEPSQAEYEGAMNRLKARDFKVDYIITHAMPRKYLKEIYYSVGSARTSYMLDDFLFLCQFRDWYCGHYHLDLDFKENFHIMYKRIVEVDL